MGEHKFILCHDEHCYFDMQKLSWYHMEHCFENAEAFDKSYRGERASALMRFVNAHRGCHLEWRGEYHGHESNNEGFPPRDYDDVTDNYLK